MLPGTCFGDDPPFAEPSGEERLSDGVIDLMCTGVDDVFALDVNLRAAQFPS